MPNTGFSTNKSDQPLESLVMKNLFLLRSAIVVIMAYCSLNGSAIAQSPPDQERSITMSIDGLTSEVRDGIAKDLQRNGGNMRLVYACVPAGILVFEQQHVGSRQQMRESITPILEHRIQRQRISVATIDRATAEERCAQFRNQ